jgi:hypothetical protein
VAWLALNQKEKKKKKKNHFFLKTQINNFETHNTLEFLPFLNIQILPQRHNAEIVNLKKKN